ncbi:hypothetical protein [uncultured Maribacter sp.]|uniref:hypothetical protein n=1 Tax=uncultured Maribacter sp. TaxID=431308 RepID=UPI002615AD30|nr:hypothetical protein [uncultured Maribacter sp.]
MSRVLTGERWKELGTKEVTNRVIGSLFIALSGLLLYLDKVLLFLEIEGDNTYGFSDYHTFIWVFMQSLVPLIMIIGFHLKPYSSSYLIPIYCYTIQIIWVFRPDMKIDNVLLHVFAIGSCILFIVLTMLIKNIFKWRKCQVQLKEEFQHETQEILHILKAKTISEN